MSNIDELGKELRSITAYDFLSSTATAGDVFTTRVVMSFIKVKYGEEALRNGLLTEAQSKAFTEVDTALSKLFETFKDGYFDNVINTVNKVR